MKKIRMCFPNEKTFREGFEEYILDCKARNLRDGTINHYQESIKQIYKRITPDTLISSMCQQTMANFYISLRDDPNLNEVFMGTYARDLKTLMRFFMKRKYLPRFEIPLPKASKTPIQTYTENEDILKILKEYLQYKGGKADDWLFCSVYGKQLTRSSNYHALWDYCHERGVEQTGVHRFRHTFAKKWAIMGGSVVTLQKILGHSSLAITEGYLNLLTSDLKKEMDEVNIIRSLKQEHIQMRAS